MSIRSIILGVFFALLLVCIGHFNDAYIGQTPLVGNHFPIYVVGILLLFVLFINPILRSIKKLSFSKAELAILFILPLSVAVIPGSGFLRMFTPALIMPKHYYNMTPTWQKNDAMSYVPENLFVVYNTDDEEKVMGAFLQGTGDISLDSVPWEAWLPALERWLPLFFCVMSALICFSMMLHRQWSSHEHLVYPIAEFVDSVIVEDDSSRRKFFRGITAQKLFWYGVIPVLVIHIVNGIHTWNFGFIEIPRSINLTSLKELFPNLAVANGGWAIFRPQIFFTVLAFAYFLPSDITLSLGITPMVGAWFSIFFSAYGITLTGKFFADGEIQGMIFGAYVGLFSLLLYTGRAYYYKVAKSAFGFKTKGDNRIEASSVWGFRAFLVFSFISICLMARMGAGWFFASCVMFLLVLLFTVMSRICAETGLFFIQANWLPVGAILGFMGAAAIGPTCLFVVMMISLIICVDPRESLMPFIVNSYKIADNVNIRRGPVGSIFIVLLAVGLVLGTVVVLMLQYGKGVALSDAWGTAVVPQTLFKQFSMLLQQVDAYGLLDASSNMGFLDRLSLIKPNMTFISFAGFGLFLFSLFAFLRIRFSKWPFHPVIFLVVFSYPIMRFGFSFLLGWLIKVMIVKLGGGAAYQRNKSFMIGMIVGDLLGGILFMLVGYIYYLTTGYTPASYRIFPG